MKKRTLCLLLAGAMSLSLLSGCGDRKPVDKKTKDALRARPLSRGILRLYGRLGRRGADSGHHRINLEL